MNTVSSALFGTRRASDQPDSETAPSRWQRFPVLPMALTFVFFALTLLPSVQANSGLVWTFSGVAATLIAWELLLWTLAARNGRLLRVQFAPIKSHYVQASVQLGIMVYWGVYAESVVAQAPLILAQMLFLYAFEGLVTWSRGRVWRLGFGPLPIVLSTNLLLWFKDDWFVFQFLMLTAGALAKQFITWNRDGRRAHIFNPSAFGQTLFALVLIATGTTQELTWGREIATSFETPHMLIVIFCLGLIVQYFFHVTLMTLAAAATLCLVNLIYTGLTDVYFFVNINFAAPIFLGIHLLVTDPSTSPRTSVGRVIFGVLYGLGYCVLFRVLDLYDVPLFWDKLLPVPILNLCVPLIDRLASFGSVGKWNRGWESLLPARSLNFVHMGAWIALFLTMLATGFVAGPHAGNSIPFWKKAVADGKPHAGSSLVMVAGAQAEGGGSGEAFNELGLICMEGKIVKQNRGTAARYFAKACELGNINGCANVAIQYLFLHERRSDADVARAFDQLEAECNRVSNWGICFLVGVAYETGRGRPLDPRRAIELYERSGLENLYAVKGLARIALLGGGEVSDLTRIPPILERACAAGDAESGWYLAYFQHEGKGGLPRDDLKARMWLERACKLGAKQACQVLEKAEWPPFSKPVMLVPTWSSAFPE
ncbi:MAG: RnfABCDGE type electron transport complex subunit D [Planctomycetota bacterium]